MRLLFQTSYVPLQLQPLFMNFKKYLAMGLQIGAQACEKCIKTNESQYQMYVLFKSNHGYFAVTDDNIEEYRKVFYNKEIQKPSRVCQACHLKRLNHGTSCVCCSNQVTGNRTVTKDTIYIYTQVFREQANIQVDTRVCNSCYYQAHSSRLFNYFCNYKGCKCDFSCQEQLVDHYTSEHDTNLYKTKRSLDTEIHNSTTVKFALL